MIDEKKYLEYLETRKQMRELLKKYEEIDRQQALKGRTLTIQCGMSTYQWLKDRGLVESRKV